MTQSISKAIPTPLEAEYKKLVAQTARQRSNASAENSGTTRLSNRDKDIVTLSSKKPAIEVTVKLKPSKPVEHVEKQALQSHFSVYG
mgnify:CR=1 FL=1